MVVLSAPMPRAAVFWGWIDALLLVTVIGVSADMLVRMGAVQSLVWMLCYAVALLRIAMTWPDALLVLRDNRAVALFPVVCLGSSLWSQVPAASLEYGAQLVMTFAIAGWLGWRYSLTLILGAVAWVITASVLLSLLHWATGIFPWPVYTSAGGLGGLYLHKNMLGQKALLCGIALVTVLTLRRGEGRGAVGPPALALVLAAAALVLSQSMTSVLLFPLTLLACLLINRRRVPAPLFVPVVVALALGPVTLAVLGADPVALILGAVGKSPSLTGRTDLWAVGLEVIADHPLLGLGYAAFPAAPDYLNARLEMTHIGALTVVAFHNFLLESAVAAGIPGLVSMMLLLGTTIRRLLLLRTRTGSVAAGGALVMTGCVITASLLGASLYRQHEFMLVLVVLFAVSAGEELRCASCPRSRGRAAR